MSAPVNSFRDVILRSFLDLDSLCFCRRNLEILGALLFEQVDL